MDNSIEEKEMHDLHVGCLKLFFCVLCFSWIRFVLNFLDCLFVLCKPELGFMSKFFILKISKIPSDNMTYSAV